MYEPARRNAVNSLMVGVVLLAYGFYTSPIYLVTDAGLHNTTVSLFHLMLRIGGGLFLIVAAVLFAGVRFGLVLDALLTVGCGLIMGVCGLYWIMEDGLAAIGSHLIDVLYIAFSVLFMKAAFGSLGAYKRGDGAGAPAVAVVPPEEPVHPASVHPDTLPTDGSAPTDGYLAALSKEKGEPPDASHR